MKKIDFKQFNVWIFVIISVLLILRLVLPIYLKDIINSSLAKNLGQYEGSIQDFDLSLYRGAYQLDGLVIKKKNSNIEPLLKIQTVDIALSWAALFKKEISAIVEIEKMDVVISDSKEKQKRQYGAEEDRKNWQNVIKTIVPISIENLLVKNSSIKLQNLDFTQGNSIQLENVFLSVQNLRTRDPENLSPIEISGLLQGHSHLGVIGQTDILSIPPRISLDITLNGYKMNTMNTLLRHYIPIDITAGTLDIYSEAAYEDSKAYGYAKIFLKDADVIAPKQNFISGKHFLIEIASAFANWVLANNKTKKVAVQIPFRYENSKLDVNPSDVFWSSVANKFDALDPKLDHSVSISKGVKSL